MFSNLYTLVLSFIKEMVLGKTTLKYNLKRHKVRLVFFTVVILSFITNWITIPKLFSISNNYIQLEKEVKALSARVNDCNLIIAEIANTRNNIEDIRKLVASKDSSNPNKLEETIKDNNIAAAVYSAEIDINKIIQELHDLEAAK